jgi:hypothetical protein
MRRPRRTVWEWNGARPSLPKSKIARKCTAFSGLQTLNSPTRFREDPEKIKQSHYPALCRDVPVISDFIFEWRVESRRRLFLPQTWPAPPERNIVRSLRPILRINYS